MFDLPKGETPLPRDIIRNAWFSADRQLRLTLTRTWRAGPHVCFCGLNPSTAGADRDDPTSHRWIRFANAWGFGGYVAVNLYPFIAADPAACRKWADWLNNGPDYYVRDAIIHNLDIVRIEAKRAALFVACWGATAWDDAWVDHVVEEIQTGSAPWPDIHCFGKTAGGDPIHPMARGRHRVPDDALPVVWRAR